MRRFGSVYTITNTATNELYVGQTRREFRYRINHHRWTAKTDSAVDTKLSLAMKKHGIENFVFVEIYEAFSKDELDRAEKHFIADLGATYNMTRGGSGCVRTIPYSQEELDNKAKATKKSWEDPVVRNNRMAGIMKHAQSDAHRDRVRKFATGRVMPRSAVAATSKSKYKPVACVELGITFLSRMFAADYVGAKRSTITEAIKHGRKVFGKYTFQPIGAAA